MTIFKFKKQKFSNEYHRIKQQEYRKRNFYNLKKYSDFYKLFHILFNENDIELINDYTLKLKLTTLKEYGQKK